MLSLKLDSKIADIMFKDINDFNEQVPKYNDKFLLLLKQRTLL